MRQRRIRLEGHCKAGVNGTCTVADTWWKNKKRKTKEYFYRIDTLLEDTELATAGEIKTTIMDRTNLRKRTHMLRAVLSK